MREHDVDTRKRDAARLALWVMTLCTGALGLLYSKDSPAPPPPIPDCATGIPATLVIEYGPPAFDVPVNSHLGGLIVQAYDVAGHPLREVPITFTAPASGPGGTFNIITDPANDSYIPTPSPLTTTVNTASTCEGAKPIFIANASLGNYLITATSGAAPALFASIDNVPAPTAPMMFALGAPGIAHVNAAFQALSVQTRFQPGPDEVGGIPVTFAAPASGPSASFADGSTTATTLTNAFGRAYSPILTANNVVGNFNVTVNSPGATPIYPGPLINAAGTVTTLERSSEVPTTTVFGHAVGVIARVRFPGFPNPSFYSRVNISGGSVVLKSDGIVIANGPIDTDQYAGPCAGCVDLMLSFYLQSVTLPFGDHLLTAEYRSEGPYESSVSNAIAQTVVPEFTGPTANGAVQSMVGITGGTPETWLCTLSGAEWTSVASAGATAPPAYAIPFGLFRYRLDHCGYTGATFSTPPAGIHAQQVLVLQFTQPLVPGAAFLNYGPTPDNPSPHWYQLQSKVSGSVMQVTLGDSDRGDDDLAENGVIAGLGGPAVIQDQNPQPSGSYEGLWWNAPAGSESGWGINFAHQGDVIVATWFTYDLKGKGWWLAMTAPSSGGDTFSGAIYQATGPSFDAVPFDPAQVFRTPVGAGTLTFTDGANGTFAYTVNGISQSKHITREVFGVLPVCNFNALNDLATATNYQDLWWNSPVGSESGWGINLTHQSDTIFGTWFTYDLDHTSMWLAVTANRNPLGTYAGDLFRTTGPPFNAVPFDPAAVQRVKVGTASFYFSDGNTASFSYTVNGISQSKTITREVFRAPGTLCR